MRKEDEKWKVRLLHAAVLSKSIGSYLEFCWLFISFLPLHMYAESDVHETF